MNRLTKTYHNKTFGVADDLPCGENSYDFKNLLIQKLGEYEDLEEQGLLIKLPCKVGDTVKGKGICKLYDEYVNKVVEQLKKYERYVYDAVSDEDNYVIDTEKAIEIVKGAVRDNKKKK